MANGILLKWLPAASHHSATIRTCATVKLATANCQPCSSKPFLSFGTFEHRSLQQRRLRKKHNSGENTIVWIGPKERFCSVKLWSCDVVGSKELFRATQLYVGEDGRCLVLRLDYWFDISWPMAFSNCHQPPCSGSRFSCSPQAGGPGFSTRCRPRQTGGQLLHTMQRCFCLS